MPPKFIQVSSFQQDEINRKVQERVQQMKINSVAQHADKTQEAEKNNARLFKMFSRKSQPDPVKEAKAALEMQQLLDQARQEVRYDIKARQQEIMNSNEGQTIADHVNAFIAMPYRDEFKKALFRRRLKQNATIQDFVENKIT